MRLILIILVISLNLIPIKSQTIKLNFPNGKENIFSDTIISWEGVSKNDLIRLDYSLNNGVNWTTITDSATNLNYIWTNIPHLNSNQCLVKATNKNIINPSFKKLWESFGTISEFAFSDDFQKLAVCSNKMWSGLSCGGSPSRFYSKVYIVDMKTNKVIVSFETGDNEVTDMSFNKDATKIVICTFNDGVSLWDIITGQKIKDLDKSSKMFSSVKYSPNDKYIITGNLNGSLKFWDPNSFSLIKEFLLSSEINSIVCNNNFEKIAICNRSTSLYIINPNNLEITDTIQNIYGDVKHIEFSKDNKKLLICTYNNATICWDLQDKKLINSFQNGDKLFFTIFDSIDDNIIHEFRSNLIYSWYLKEKQLIQRYVQNHSPIIYKMKYNVANNLIYLFDNTSNSIATFDNKNKKLIGSIYGNYQLNGSNVSTDKYSIVAGGYGDINIWNYITGESKSIQKAHKYQVNSLIFIDNGNKLVTCSDDYLIKLWDFNNFKLLKTFEGHTNSVMRMVISPDEKYIYSVSRDNMFIKWDIETGIALKSIICPDMILSLSISLNNKYVLAGSYSGDLIVYDIKKGTFTKNHKINNKYIKSVSLNNNGTKFISCESVGTTQIIETETGNIIKVLSDTMMYLNSVKFSPNNKIIVGASVDNFLYIWDAVKGNLIRKYKNNTYGISNIEFSKDGSKIVMNATNEEISAWDLDSNYYSYDISDDVFSIQTINNIKEEANIKINIFPNPTNGISTIVIESEATGKLILKVVDILGKEVKRIEKVKTGNSFSLQFDGTNLTTGTYQVQLEINGQVIAKRNVIIQK